MDYAWDPAKAASNIQKHHVSFVEAQSVFDDPLAKILEDDEHSEIELREFIVAIPTKIVCCWFALASIKMAFVSSVRVL